LENRRGRFKSKAPGKGGTDDRLPAARPKRVGTDAARGHMEPGQRKFCMRKAAAAAAAAAPA
jgi:hypothetical protein